MISSRWASVLVTTAMAAASGLARADGVPDRAIRKVDNSVSLSFLYSHVGYGERLNGPSQPYLDTDSGFTGGGRIALTGLKDDLLPNLYLRVSFSQVSGGLHYNGGIQNANGTTSPLQMTEHSKMTDWAVRLGQGFVIARPVLLTPYITFGTHTWDRGEPASAGAPYDYTEQYSNKYFGGGMLFQVAATRRTVISVNLAYAETVRPQIDVPSQQLHEGLGTSPWKRAGLSIDYRPTANESLFAGARFTTFSYGQGPLVPISSTQAALEPYSKTDVVDYMLGLRILY